MNPVNCDYSVASLNNYCGQILEKLSEFNNRNKPDVIIGASIGAATALKLASETVKPKALILISSLVPNQLLREAEQKVYTDLIEWEDSSYEETDNVLFNSDEDTKKKAHSRWRNESGNILNELQQLDVDKNKIQCPILCIIPSNDTDVSPDAQYRLANCLDADIFIFSKMRHSGPLLSTRVEEVALISLQWLKNNLKN